MLILVWFERSLLLHELDDKVATNDTKDVDLPEAVIGGSGVNGLTQDSTINFLSNS